VVWGRFGAIAPLEIFCFAGGLILEFLFPYANHKYRERWLSEEWFWYQAQEGMVDFSAPLSGEDVTIQLEERLKKISLHLGKDTQTEGGRKFEHFAELFDDDAALTAM
jgi:hypothetical protein